ncbi:uncharacterized protein LOC113352627 [Papaver somniferum]|uniref:uncharacterized protein LOC113352627 n=1 Tax=Papaver somniferum TaxID=3469 RepID=UPI000E6F5BDB|nr:uncharacterized protein LOC113352627 [Papaver somniferum]
MSHHQTGLSFRFLNQELARLYPYLLGASNGLVLYTTNIYNQIRYYVCNPLTQKWVSLPPPPPRENNWAVAGLICNQCLSESSTSYKVIRIPQVKAAAKEFRVEIYSSDLGEWNVVSCPPRATWEVTIHDNFVTLNGVLYWFQQQNSEVLAFSVDRNTNDGTCGNECRLINIPYLVRDRYDFTSLSECLGESEGLICFARFKYKEMSLSVWVLDVDWYVLHQDIQLYDWLAEIETRLCDGSDGRDLMTEIRIAGFSPVDKNVVILSFKEYVWAYNTKTRVYEQLCHPSFLRSNVPSVPRLRALEFILKPRPTTLPPVSWE